MVNVLIKSHQGCHTLFGSRTLTLTCCFSPRPREYPPPPGGFQAGFFPRASAAPSVPSERRTELSSTEPRLTRGLVASGNGPHLPLTGAHRPTAPPGPGGGPVRLRHGAAPGQSSAPPASPRRLLGLRRRCSWSGSRSFRSAACSRVLSGRPPWRTWPTRSCTTSWASLPAPARTS